MSTGPHNFERPPKAIARFVAISVPLIAAGALVWVALGLLAGCTSMTWDRAGTTQSEIAMDEAACRMEADMALCMHSRGYKARAAYGASH